MVMKMLKVFEMYSVKRIALGQSPCGIPKVVVKVCPFVLLFFYLQCHNFQENIHNF